MRDVTPPGCWYLSPAATLRVRLRLFPHGYSQENPVATSPRYHGANVVSRGYHHPEFVTVHIVLRVAVTVAFGRS